MTISRDWLEYFIVWMAFLRMRIFSTWDFLKRSPPKEERAFWAAAGGEELKKKYLYFQKKEKDN